MNQRVTLAAARPGSLVCLCLAACLLLAACGGGQPELVDPASKKARSPEEVSWYFQSKGVRVNLRATADLNSNDRQPHTVLLCVYQLKTPDAFNALAATAEGLGTLLQCKPFDASAVAADSTIIAPGHIKGLVYDRAEGARLVALVAGYATLDPKRVTRVKAVPVLKETTGSLWWKEDLFYPGTLEMAVVMGAYGLQQQIWEGAK